MSRHRDRRRTRDRDRDRETTRHEPAESDEVVAARLNCAVGFLGNHLGQIGSLAPDDDDEAWKARGDSLLDAAPPAVRDAMVAALVAAARHVERSFGRRG